MNITDIDPEDNLLEPLPHETGTQAIKHLPGGQTGLIILILSCIACFGLGLLAGKNLAGQGTGVVEDTASAALHTSAALPLNSSQTSSVGDAAASNTAIPGVQ